MAFRRFRYFLVAAEELNLQKAAQRLFISQQALSIHIQKLEEEYGVQLFERRPRLRLTLAGEHMVEHCRRLLEDDRLMTDDLTGIGKSSAGKITIGIGLTRGHIFIPPIWSEFHRVFPNISIAAKTVTNLKMEEGLMRGEIDLYIGANTLKIAPFRYVPLASEMLCCIVHRSVLREYGVNDVDRLLSDAARRFDLREFLRLAKFPYVLMPQTHRTRIQLDRFFYEAGIVPDIVCECNSITMLWEMCCRGCGVGFLPPFMLYDPHVTAALDPDLCIFPIYEPELIFDVDIVRLAAREPSRAISEFIRVTQNVYRRYSQIILHL